MDNNKKTYSNRQHDILFAVYAFLVLGLFTICVYLMITAIASPSLSSTMVYGVVGIFVGIASLSSGEWMLPTLEKMFIKEQRKMVNNNHFGI